MSEAAAGASPIAILARLTWLRLRRGRAKWVSALLALTPPVLGLLLELDESLDPGDRWKLVLYLSLVPVLLATALHLASAVGDELESRTYTYLWSRPMPRRALIFGKLLGTLPMVAVAFFVSITVLWAVIWQGDAGAHLGELGRALFGVAGAIVASAALALVAGTFFPRYPLAIMLGYVLIGDQLLSIVPAVRQLSITYQAGQLAGVAMPGMPMDGTLTSGLVTLLALTAVWLGLALWRVERTEYALPDG
jgi:ABC-type transport system involved in multi-copper enzyme maturation permease subunit